MPNESTTKTNIDVESLSSGDSDANTTPQDVDNRLWDEMEAPWPATYERAISLFASPIIKAEKAKDLTKSPKPGNTPLAIRNRLLKRTRSANTSELTGLVPPPSRRTGGVYYDNYGEVTKVDSMDFDTTKAHLKAQAKNFSLEKTQKNLESKRKEAADYRKKILSKQPKQKGKNEGAISSAEKTTFFQCIFNLANILMGVGLLGLPFAFAQSGYFGGTFATVSFALVCWKTSILIGRELNGDPRPLHLFAESSKLDSERISRMRKPIRSFPDIAREAFGKPGAVVLGIILYFELFSCIAIFIVSMGDHMHKLFPFLSVTMHMVGITIVSTVPVIVFRTAGLLSYLSLIGTIATIFVVLAVVLSFFIEGDITNELALKSDLDTMYDTGSHHELWNTAGLNTAFGLVAYCFSGHAIIPSIYSSMQKPHEFERVVNVTFTIVVAACLAIGLSGYTMFGDFVLDQITLSLNQHSSAVLAMTILTWLMILTAFSKLTLTMFPLAMGFEEIVAPYVSSDSSMLIIGSVIKMVLLFSALAMALFVPSFSALCSMVGMVCTMTVSVIFPAGAYLKLFWPKISMLERVLYCILIIVGVVMSAVGSGI
jgi:vesicular inhibitory amino acid transporter